MILTFLRTFMLINILSIGIYATSLRDSVEKTLNTNPDIIAEHFNKKVFKSNIDEQQRDYYPTVDFSVYVEESETKYDLDDNSKQDGEKDGWNATLKIEQVLYDGGKTPNEIDMFRHRYQNVKYTSNDKVEDLIFQTANTYISLVLSQEIMALSQYKIKVHDKYLKLAKDKEEISGEILDSYEVGSKVKASWDEYYRQEVTQQKSLSSYKRLTGVELSGNICRPTLDESLFPSTFEEAIEIALRNNNQLHAQRSMISEQNSRALVEDAKNRPDLTLQVQGEWDDDLAEPENGRRDIYRIRLQSNWNLYNGGKDSVTQQKERIAILEQRKILDAIKNEVIDNIKGSYTTYYKIKDRLENLKLFIDDNKKITEIYNKQLSDGSRTFIDVLNAESEYFRTKLLYIETEFSLYDEYYNILKSLNVLSDTILIEKNQVCQQYMLDESELEIKKEKAPTEDELADELGLD